MPRLDRDGVGIHYEVCGRGPAILLTHGGSNDVYSAMGVEIIDFEASAGLAVDYLTGYDRLVVDCPHTNGHQPHPQISVADMLSFFRDHRAGEDSPYAGGYLPSALEGICELE